MTDTTSRARRPVLGVLLVTVAVVSAGGCRSAGAAPDEWPAAVAGRATGRAVALIAGADVERRVTPRGEVLVRPTGPHRRGTAAALTADGYHLTAAHCVDRGPVHLLVRAGDGGWALARAEVVWSSRAAGYKQDWADLALIHVDAGGAPAVAADASGPPPAAFPWSPARSLAPGSAVGAARSAWALTPRPAPGPG